MVNYEFAKIYKIVDNTNGNIYIGSTCEPTLARRLAGHRRKYKGYLENKYNFVSSFDILKNDNYEIVLLEECKDITTKDQLHKRERFYIEHNICVNKFIPTRTDKEYYENNKERYKQYRQDNKDLISEYKKEYRRDNKEKISEYHKQYNQDNKEKISEYHKQYNQDNKEKILERQKQYNQDNKEKISEYNKQYNQDNKEKKMEYNKAYREKNKEKINESRRERYRLNKIKNEE